MCTAMVPMCPFALPYIKCLFFFYTEILFDQLHLKWGRKRGTLFKKMGTPSPPEKDFRCGQESLPIKMAAHGPDSLTMLCLFQDVDKATSSRIVLEKQREHLEAELEFLKRVNQQVGFMCGHVWVECSALRACNQC